MDRLDPRTKLWMILCLSTAVMMVDDILFLIASLVFTVVIMLIGGIRWQDQKRQLIGAISTILFLFVLQAVFGDPLLGAVLSVRLTVIILSAMILLTGQPRDYLLALTQMKVPYELSFMVILAFHFFPILKEEAQDVYYSIQLRGTELQKCSLRKKLKAYRKMCIPILASAMDRAKDTALSMEARGFRAYKTRTYMRKLKLKWFDFVVMGVFVVLTITFIICGR